MSALPSVTGSRLFVPPQRFSSDSDAAQRAGGGRFRRSITHRKENPNSFDTDLTADVSDELVSDPELDSSTPRHLVRAFLD